MMCLVLLGGVCNLYNTPQDDGRTPDVLPAISSISARGARGRLLPTRPTSFIDICIIWSASKP